LTPVPSARDLLKAYEEQINAHDFDRLVPLIAPNAVFWFSDGSHRGFPAIRAAFERTWRLLSNDTYWLDQLDWIAEGDTAAACLYRFNWRAGHGDSPASGTGRGTTVLRQDAGRWQIVHEHLSTWPA
jgi:ketosteroid isomerase-like protein